jgi:DMSO reductase anchor subunit
MHPAFSVIFFTTASGAGYGLLALLGAGSFFGFLPAHKMLMIVSALTALALVTGGLLSSTFHLGHPERAWRALSQWRSSWLSREGVLALLTYLPASLLLLEWLGVMEGGALTAYSGLAVAALAFTTVYTTAMIYASLRSIHSWCNKWVPVNYLLFALSSGCVLLNAFLAWFGALSETLLIVTIAAVSVSAAAKVAYWRFIDTSSSKSTIGTALGVATNSSIKLTQVPHTETNYLQQEMGFAIARKHARKLRRLVIIMAFVLPLLLAATAIAIAGKFAAVCCTLAVPIVAVGIVIERWLFFAEAKHSVTLYYGAANA